MFLETSAIWKRLFGNCVKTGSCPGRGFGYPDRGCLQLLALTKCQAQGSWTSSGSSWCHLHVVLEPWEQVAECHCWNRMTCNAGPAFSPEAHSASHAHLSHMWHFAFGTVLCMWSIALKLETLDWALQQTSHEASFCQIDPSRHEEKTNTFLKTVCILQGRAPWARHPKESR